LKKQGQTLRTKPFFLRQKRQVSEIPENDYRVKYTQKKFQLQGNEKFCRLPLEKSFWFLMKNSAGKPAQSMREMEKSGHPRGKTLEICRRFVSIKQTEIM
jgi:hypothetical protein